MTMMFLFKLILFGFFILALRLIWRLGWSIYWWRQQLKNASAAQAQGPRNWRFVFTRGPRGGFYQSSSAHPQDEAAPSSASSDASSASAYPPGGEVIDAQFRVLSEKDDN
ncbi:MAG: hypothetical protein J6Y94_03635 [Bacteriovoracaceae bacterium]|nr:hypothetical protein [Bacteriovoracaceae bacterium]